MVVLQLPTIGIESKKGGGLAKEGQYVVERIDSAVEYLAARGIIDPHRVGMTGFSRAGYQTFYTITHPGRVRLAAAVCADSFTGGYPAYLEDAALGLLVQDFESRYDGSFWKNNATWLERETTFNIDRVVTPVLMSENDGSTAYGTYNERSLQIIGAFALNKKPLEYLYFPTGSHQLKRPREREAMLEAVVDWMAFWLKNEEDSRPEKQEQYVRWRAMKSQAGPRR
jgi:dipeptidyl aminopeptidase/acylaminoacyl peptidase